LISSGSVFSDSEMNAKISCGEWKIETYLEDLILEKINEKIP